MECCECGKTFTRRQSLFKHRKNIHKSKPTGATKWKCLEDNGVCTFSGRDRKELITHLKSYHHMDIDEEELIFPCWADFEKWKVEEEKNTCTSYILSGGNRNTLSEKVIYFSCNRSGFFKSMIDNDEERRRAPKRHGSVKCNQRCIASMVARINKENDNVTVFYTPDHYGHEITPTSIPIDKETRALIAAKLQCGYTPDQIISDLKSNPGLTCTSRVGLINRRDVINIKRQFKIESDEVGISVPNYIEEIDIQELICSAENTETSPCGQSEDLEPDKKILILTTSTEDINVEPYQNMELIASKEKIITANEVQSKIENDCSKFLESIHKCDDINILQDIHRNLEMHVFSVLEKCIMNRSENAEAESIALTKNADEQMSVTKRKCGTKRKLNISQTFKEEVPSVEESFNS